MAKILTNARWQRRVALFYLCLVHYGAYSLAFLILAVFTAVGKIPPDQVWMAAIVLVLGRAGLPREFRSVWARLFGPNEAGGNPQAEANLEKTKRLKEGGLKMPEELNHEGVLMSHAFLLLDGSGSMKEKELRTGKPKHRAVAEMVQDLIKTFKEDDDIRDMLLTIICYDGNRIDDVRLSAYDIKQSEE